MNRPIGILMDLQGPKLRVGKFENGPIFYRGFYITDKKNKLDFPEEYLTKTSLLNHDAF